MALTNLDFLLTDEQLGRIESYFHERAIGYAEEGEDFSEIEVKVTFEFHGIYGRFVTAFYGGGATQGGAIEDPLSESDQPSRNSNPVAGINT